MNIKPFRSIRHKLILYFVLMTMIPFLYIGYEGIRSARNSLRDTTLQEIFLDVYSKSKDMEDYLRGAKADLLYLRGLPALGYFLEAGALGDRSASVYWKTLLEKDFYNFLKQKRDFARIGFLDENGKEKVVTLFDQNRVIILPESKLYNQKENSFFQQGLEMGGGEVSVFPLRNFVEEGRDLGNLSLLRFIAQVHDMDGVFKGILYFDITGQPFRETMVRSMENRAARAFLVNAEGRFIFRGEDDMRKAGDEVPPKPAAGSIQELYPPVVVSQILSGRPGIIEDRPDFLFAYAPVYFDDHRERPAYVVVHPYPRSLVFAGLRVFKKFFMAAGVAVVLATILLGVVVSGRLTRPLFRLKEGVQRFGEGKLDHRLDIKSGDEIEAVAAECNRMAQSLMEYRDSLERKIEERTQEIQRFQRQLFHSEKMAALGVLASGVAHEVNNPMGIIINRIECIKMENAGKGLPDQLEKDLDTIRHHAVRVSNIAGNLLALSRKPSSGFAEQDINQLLERIFLLTEAHLKSRGIRLEKNLAPDLPRIPANAGGLEQVFLNLIRNAMDSIGEGQEGVIGVCSRYDAEAGVLRLSFTDSGPGIPEEDRKKIFDPFFTTKETGKGSGLGLYISYTIIEEHEGRIEVKNRDAGGAEFTVVLPLLRRDFPQGTKVAIDGKREVK